MILTLLIMIAVVVLIAVFIGKNLAYSTPIWLFKTFDATNIAVIVFFAFAAGIVFALLCLMLGKVIKASKIEESAKTAEENSSAKKQPKQPKQIFKQADKNQEKQPASPSAETKNVTAPDDQKKNGIGSFFKKKPENKDDKEAAVSKESNDSGVKNV